MDPDSVGKDFRIRIKDLLGRPPSISKHGLEGFPFVTAKLQQLLSSYTADDGAKKCKKRDLFMAGIL